MKGLISPVTVAVLYLPVAAQDRVPHGRLFPSEDLGILGGPDRDTWKKPQQVMDVLGIEDGVTVAGLGAGDDWFAVRLARLVGLNGTIYAKDIQTQMIKLIARRVTRKGPANIQAILGTQSNPKLPVPPRVRPSCTGSYPTTASRVRDMLPSGVR